MEKVRYQAQITIDAESEGAIIDALNFFDDAIVNSKDGIDGIIEIFWEEEKPMFEWQKIEKGLA
jgi:hypothetical protein